MDPLAERLAAQQLHRDVVMTLVLADVVDRADVGVIERGRGARLAPEAAEAGRAFRDVLGKELERDLTAEPGVDRAVDDSHPAPAELGENPIVGDRAADQSPPNDETASAG